jgi:hypothetical protein
MGAHFADVGFVNLRTNAVQQSYTADYLKAWWNVVNWNALNERYVAAKSGHL